MLTDEQIIERCKAAGIKWIPPELPDDCDYETGFPGSFDMVNMDEMRALLSASKPAATAQSVQTGDRLTDMKANSIIERDGYKLTGVVLRKDDGARCIVELSAVRWLSKDEMWSLMQPDAAPAQSAELVEQAPIGYISHDAANELRTGPRQWAKVFSVRDVGIPGNMQPVYTAPQPSPPAQSAPALDDERAAKLVEALEETQGLLVAMLHETRPREEIEVQIGDNRTTLQAWQARAASPQAQPAQTRALTLDDIRGKAVDQGFQYWNASDDHGVVATTAQAVELLQDLLNIQVEIKPASGGDHDV